MITVWQGVCVVILSPMRTQIDALATGKWFCAYVSLHYAVIVDSNMYLGQWNRHPCCVPWW